MATLTLASVGEPAAAVASPVGLACQASASVAIPQPTKAQLDAAGLGDIPLAPESARRDLVAAPFSDSTSVTNPLFPIADLDSAILNGRVDGKPFYTETTLLPFTRIIEWTPGQCVRVLVSQYMAFLDGRLQETAIALYAQADDGSVFHEGAQEIDVTLLEQLAQFVQCVHLQFDHRVSPFIVLPRTYEEDDPGGRLLPTGPPRRRC